MYDFTGIALLMISLVFAILSTFVLPWIKARLNTEQLAYVRMAVEVAVYAAEKLYGAGNGDKKLAHAEKVLAEQYNIKLDTKKLSALVDAEIKKMEQAQSGLTIIENISGSVEVEEEEAEEEEPQTEDATEGA